MNALDNESSMFAQERQQAILDDLTANSRVEVSVLARKFAISEATVRRDLASLASQGYLQKTYGGAVALDTPKLGWAARAPLRTKEKRLIGAEAAALVQPGETIVVDAGSTAYELATRLTVRPLTVVTNSLDIASVFESDQEVTLLVTGGYWDPVVRHLNGPATIAMLTQCRAHWAFIGATGVDATAGITSAYSDNAETKRTMVQISQRSVVLADQTKIGVIAPHLAVPLDRVHTLITNDESSTNTFSNTELSVVIARS